MRNPQEMNPYQQRDTGTKWDLKNTDSAVIGQWKIGAVETATGRMGVVRAQAGVNVTSARMLVLSVQDVHPGNKQVFYQHGVVPFTTGAVAAGTPVYLSQATAGEITMSAPATKVVVGAVMEENKVMIDLRGLVGPNVTATATPILHTNEYWVNPNATQASRQFTTIAAAITQAELDLAAGQTATINLTHGQTPTLPANIAATLNYVFRGGVVLLNGCIVADTGSVAFQDCTLSGLLTVNNPTSIALLDCTASNVVITVDTGQSAGNVVVVAEDVRGSLMIKQINTVTAATMTYTAKNCSFRLTTTATTVATVIHGTVVLEDCSITDDGNGINPISAIIGAGKTGVVTLEHCRVTAPTIPLFVGGGVTTPTITINGGHYRVSSIAIVYTATDFPYFDLGVRSGAVAGAQAAMSRRPSYQAGRSVAIYSTASSKFLGHPNVIEYTATHTGDGAEDCTQPMNGNATTFLIPSGEIWRIECHRIIVNGATFHSNYRQFLVRNNAGTITVKSGTTTDPDPLSVQIGSIAIIDGGGGTFTVQSVAANGYTTHITAHITAAYGKAAF